MKANSKLFIVVGVFTVLQLLVLAVFGYTPYPDSNGYLGIARECLAQGESYPTCRQLVDLQFVWNVGAINAVYYSLKLFGSIVPLLVVYAFLKGVTAWLFYKVAERLMNASVAWLALAVYVLYLPNYGECTSLISELPFIFFCMLSLYLMICRRMYILGGVVLAVANWMRPFSLVFVVSMVVYILLLRQRCVARIGKLLAGYVVMVGILGGCCWLRTGKFIYQAQSGWAMLMKNHWLADSDRRSDRHLFPGGDPFVLPAGTRDACQRDSLWRDNFLKWLPRNVGEYVGQMPDKLVRTYVSDNANLCAFMSRSQKAASYMYEPLGMSVLKRDFPHYCAVQWAALYNLLFYYLLLAFALLGAWKALKDKRLWILLLLPMVGTAFVVLVGHGEARYHQPFMPFFIMLAAWWLSDWKARRL